MTRTQQNSRGGATKNSKADIERPPAISEATILRLYVVTGGRCSFPGCNMYLLNEPLTDRSARLGNIAHIVAESTEGPRGGDPLPMANRSEVENLMLLCPKCHLFVDKKELERDYSADLLRRFKKAHEDHIRAMTDTALNERTCAIRMVGQIRDHLVSVTDAEIRAAVFEHEGRHVERIIDIDISTIPDSADSSYITITKRKLTSDLERRVLPAIQDGTICRLSVFALGRIPLLCELGYLLGDKIPMLLYQKHRGRNENWRWPSNGERVSFEVVAHHEAQLDTARVAILVAVSGGNLENVRRATNAASVYEIRPRDVATASRMLLSAPGTLDEFRAAYHQALSRIEKLHPRSIGLDLFVAAASPIAIICGRDILRDVVPDVVVHDLIDGEYKPATVLKTKTETAARAPAPLIVAEQEIHPPKGVSA
jgi:hypothetical protein